MTFFPGQPIPFEEQSSDNRTITESTLFFGLNIDISTNLVNGNYKVVIQPEGITLFEDGALGGLDGNVKTSNEILRVFNQKQRELGQPELTQLTLQKTIEDVGIPFFNEINADTINNNASEFKRRQLANSGLVPGVIDPTTGNVTNSRGLFSSGIIDPQGAGANDVLIPNAVASGVADGVNTIDKFGERVFTFDDVLGLIDTGLSVREFASSGDGLPSSFDRSRVGNIGVAGGKLRYPQYDLQDFGYDYIRFERWSYAGKRSAKGDRSRLGSQKSTVELPMQPQLSESNSVDWGADRLNPIQKAAAEIAKGAITDIGNSQSLKDAAGAIGAMFQAGGAKIREFASDPEVPAAIKAYFAGQALGVNVLARRTGSIVNPNLELLFSSGRLRTFNFNFNLTPRNMVESCICRNIILDFKQGMAPKTKNSELFLFTPDVYKIIYCYNGSTNHPFMNRIKPCALTNLKVNYTPDNAYMTYENGSMTRYNLTMSFTELEPVYQKDQKTAGGTGY